MRASKFADALVAGAVLVGSLAGINQARAADTATNTAVVAWLRDGRVEVRTLAHGVPAAIGLSSADPAAKVPLGSLWKLFVFAYLTETRAQEPAYVCAQKASEEERYCCSPGASVTRDQALARSCAPYFSPARLGITPARWQTHLQGRSPVAAWLTDIRRLQPGTEVPLHELLTALAAMPPETRAQARGALLDTGLQGYGRGAWTTLGTGIRYKTYSWHLGDGSAFGGAAGWLPDGTPFWFGARGTSRSALAAWADPLASALPTPRWHEATNTPNASGGVSCVDVDFFTRYSLRAVWQADRPVQVKAGDLNGRYRLEFVNGSWLDVVAHGELTLTQRADGTPGISGRFAINDYVARVIDREGSGQPPEAARALAIAARSYLMQNARFEAGCRRIADSSRTQRVSANPPSPAALAAAWFTDDIILKGVPVQYHHDQPGPNRLAWRSAVAQAADDWNFERILTAAYPEASIATLSGSEECTRQSDAEQWLVSAASAWQARLRREPGFEPLDVAPRICVLAEGHPYSDQQRRRIYVRGWRSLDERITLAHEYLHLVFQFHPNGADEAYVERLARRLIEG